MPLAACSGQMTLLRHRAVSEDRFSVVELLVGATSCPRTWVRQHSCLSELLCLICAELKTKLMKIICLRS